MRSETLATRRRTRERLADVPRHELRAAHGLRRMVVKDILAETGGDIEASES